MSYPDRHPNPLLRGARVLVTGATGGLGPALVEGLARAGSSLILTALPDPALDEITSRVAATGVRVASMPADLRDPEAPAAVVRFINSTFGGADILVHNAGIERVGRFESCTADDIEAVIRVNLVAAVQLARLLVPGMLATGWGRLVFVSSLSGKVGPAHLGAYAASKAGLIAFARTLRAEYRGRGVTASAVVPGFVRDVGMYARGEREAGFRPSWILRTIRGEAVVRGVLRALERDAPEVLIQPGPTRFVLALGELMPGLVGQRLALWAGADRLFRDWSDVRAGDAERRPAEAPADTSPAP